MVSWLILRIQVIYLACPAGLRNESWHDKLSWHGVGAIQSVKKGLSGLGWLVWHVLLCELYSACTAGLRIESCYVYVNPIVNVYVDMYMYMYVYVYEYVVCVCV